MEQSAAIRLTVQRLTGLIRQRRALFYGLRGLLWGLFGAAILVALRVSLGPWAWPLAGGVAGVGLVGGVLYGVALRVPPGEALRLADRAFGLHDRLGTAHELLGARATTLLAPAAIDDATRHAAGLDLRRAVPWRLPRDARLLPVPLLILAALPYLPPVRLPEVTMPAMTPTTEEEKKAERVGTPQALDRPTAKKADRAERVQLQEREYAQRQNPDREQAKGDLAAAFKDTNVASKRPDFSSFLKQGDDRIRMLERVDSLPDLQRDFTQSQYKVMFRQSRSLLGADPKQMSPEKLRQLLEEMNRLGRRAGTSGSGASGGEGDWSQEMAEGQDALNKGQTSKALEAMERALNKMRAMDERDRGGKGLEGGKDQAGRGRDARGGRGGEEDMDPGDGQGSLPGKGTNPGWRGAPTQRLGQSPIDMGVEGQSRKGRKEAYDTNMIGRGAQNPSRLPYMTVYGQYRKMMEDALAKEAIPLDYRSQVKDYFQSLEER